MTFNKYLFFAILCPFVFSLGLYFVGIVMAQFQQPEYNLIYSLADTNQMIKPYPYNSKDRNELDFYIGNELFVYDWQEEENREISFQELLDIQSGAEEFFIQSYSPGKDYYIAYADSIYPNSDEREIYVENDYIRHYVGTKFMIDEKTYRTVAWYK